MKRSLSIESSIENLRVVEAFAEELSREINISKEAYGKVLVSVMEAVNNAVVHGNKLDLEKMVSVSFELIDNRLLVTVSDEGSGFSPEQVPDPTTPANIEKISGRGVYLMTRLADEIEFDDTGSTVSMFFNNVTG